jgi:hypothetical protein
MTAPEMNEPDSVPMDVVEDIRQVLLKVVPERADELREIIDARGITLVAKMQQHESPFLANAGENRITAMVPALIRHQIMSFAYTLFYRYKVREGDICARQFMPDDSPKCEAARGMLAWAMVDRHRVDVAKSRHEQPSAQERPQQWMCPNPMAAEDTDDRIAIELFYVALGSDLHHELAHIKLDHGAAELTDEERQVQEVEADAEAARWIVGDVRETAPEFERRILGLALSHLYELFLRLEGSRADVAHPPLTTRLADAIGNRVHDDDHVVWAFIGSSLTLHLESANRPQDYERDRVFPSVRSLAAYLVSVFERRYSTL